MEFRKGITRTVWVTKDGRRVPVVHMADQHLLNALRVIEKSAQLLIDGKAAKLEDVAEALNEVVPCYALMTKERDRRGLK